MLDRYGFAFDASLLPEFQEAEAKLAARNGTNESNKDQRAQVWRKTDSLVS